MKSDYFGALPSDCCGQPVILRVDKRNSNNYVYFACRKCNAFGGHSLSYDEALDGWENDRRGASKKHSLLTFLNNVIYVLNTIEHFNTKGDFWSSFWIQSRMELQRKYLNGIILTTEHGISIFEELSKDLQEKGRYLNRVRKENRIPDKEYLEFIKSFS